LARLDLRGWGDFHDDGGAAEALHAAAECCAVAMRGVEPPWQRTPIGVAALADAAAACAAASEAEPADIRVSSMRYGVGRRRRGMSFEPMHCQGASALVAVLASAPPRSLAELSLCKHILRCRGAAVLAGFIRACPAAAALTLLDLSQNHLGDDGAATLAAALPGSALTELDLFHNGVRDARTRRSIVARLTRARALASSRYASPKAVTRSGTNM
jgi:hypothetical protein